MDLGRGQSKGALVQINSRLLDIHELILASCVLNFLSFDLAPLILIGLVNTSKDQSLMLIINGAYIDKYSYTLSI